jgi:quercetin dioxygenase-like cupin family protein
LKSLRCGFWTETGDKSVTPEEVYCDAGEKKGLAVGSHPMEVYAYVLSGRFTVAMAAGKTTEFKEGDAIIEVVNFKHDGINKGNIPA